MKNILLLTDSSPKSVNAHHYALHLFRGQECNFHLLSIQKVWEYTMDDLITANPKSDLETALLSDNKEQIEQEASGLKALFPEEKYQFDGTVDYDVFTDAVNEAVKAFNADLIVCGTDGKSGIIETIFSSHTLRLIRKVNCPVLVIPEKTTFKEPRGVQYLLDRDDVFEMCGKELLITLSRKYKTKIDVIRLTFGEDTEPQKYAEEPREVQKLFPSNEVSYNTLTEEKPLAILTEMLKNSPVQMQVLSAKKETFLERLFSKSHLSQIVNGATIPLLILRDCNS